MWSAWTLNCIPNKATRTVTPYRFFVGNKPQSSKSGEPSIPSTFKEAIQFAEAHDWKLAINTKLENLQHKSVWRVKRLPKKRKALGARWVFAKKAGPNNTIRFKAFYVAKGFNQKDGTYCAHTFGVTFTLMRILLTVGARHNWPF